MSRAQIQKNVLVVQTDDENKFIRGHKKVKIEQFPTEQVDFTLSLTKTMASETLLRQCHCIFKSNCKKCRTRTRKDNAYLRLYLVFENYLHEMSHNYKYKITCSLIERTRVEQQLCSFEEVRTSRKMDFFIDTNHCLSCINNDLEETVISVVIERSCINPDPINTLQNHFLNLLDNPVHSDVEIRVGGIEFQVHRNILSCRSPVFEAMFNTDMMENETGIVDIRGISAGAMQELLRYIYSGTVENLETMTSELLAAAIKYQVDGLKDACIEYYIFNVNLENMHDFHKLLNLYDLTELRDKISTFIKNNKRIPRKDNSR